MSLGNKKGQKVENKALPKAFWCHSFMVQTAENVQKYSPLSFSFQMHGILNFVNPDSASHT